MLAHRQRDVARLAGDRLWRLVGKDAERRLVARDAADETTDYPFPADANSVEELAEVQIIEEHLVAVSLIDGNGVRVDVWDQAERRWRGGGVLRDAQGEPVPFGTPRHWSKQWLLLTHGHGVQAVHLAAWIDR